MKTILIPTGFSQQDASFSSVQLQRAIETSDDSYVCLIDDLTRIQSVDGYVAGFNDFHDLEPHVAMVTAPVMTGLGKRLGYELVASLCESRTYLRRPLRMPAPSNSKKYCEVHLPNEGWMLLRVALLQSMGGLREDLPPLQALSEFALRCLEQGYVCVSDIRRTLYRAAGYVEHCMSDEADFAGLRSTQEWQRIILQAPRKREDLPVDLILTGNASLSAQRLHTAGYPLGRIIHVEGSPVAAPAILVDALTLRRDRMVALVHCGESAFAEGWMARLMQETREREDVAVAVLGSDGVAGRIHQMDALATIFRPERIPVRSIPAVCESIDDFLRTLSANLVGTGVGIRQTADQLLREQSISTLKFQLPNIGRIERPARISIITLSIGVNDVNELTVNRLRANTRAPYDLSVIANRHQKDIINRIETDTEIKLFIAGSDATRSEAMSAALAQVEGEYIAILRDDVVIPDKWIDPLEQAMLRIPYAGIVAPRVSNGSGAQIAENERFANTAEFHLSANRRRKEYARMSMIVSTISQPIFLLRREVVERIGGFDPAFGLSELGIIDYCIRVQAAGYKVIIAEDAMLHRIHPDLIQNKEHKTTHEPDHSKAFSKKWQLDRESFSKLQVTHLIHSDLAKAQMKIALPQIAQQSLPHHLAEQRAIFLLPLEDEEAWQDAARLVKKYHKAFNAADPVSLAIGCGEASDIANAVRRVERIVRALHIDLDVCADVMIADASNRDVWLQNLPQGPRFTLIEDKLGLPYPQIRDVTPAGLRHSLAQALLEVN